MEKYRVTDGLEALWRKAMGEIRPSLQLRGNLRCVDTTALELHRYREQSVFIGTGEEENIITSFPFHFVSREGQVGVYQDPGGRGVLHGYPAPVSSA